MYLGLKFGTRRHVQLFLDRINSCSPLLLSLRKAVAPLGMALMRKCITRCVVDLVILIQAPLDLCDKFLYSLRFPHNCPLSKKLICTFLLFTSRSRSDS